MIARLRGRVAGRAGGGLIVDVNGVGYLVHAAPSVSAGSAASITIEVRTIVREDALQLYGFATAGERELFELLLGVSGVGPEGRARHRLGLDACRAAPRDRPRRREAVPGDPGRQACKTAQRVVLELKEKLNAADALVAEANDATLARDALVKLGWSLLDAERALADGRRGSAGRTAGCGKRCGRPHDASSWRLCSPTPRRRSRRRCGRAARRVHRPGQASRRTCDRHRRRPGARRAARPRAPLRPARPRQDHARAHHRARDGRRASASRAGPAIERPGDLAAILTNLEPGDVLFIDEIHRLPRVVEEILYPAMEDFALDIVIGKGPARAHAPPRSAAVHAGRRHHAHAMMTPPLRDRFGSVYRLDFYDAGRARTDRAALAPASSASTSTTTARRRSRRARAARRASPTACCAACATTPRSRHAARSPRRRAARRSAGSRSTSSASTRSTTSPAHDHRELRRRPRRPRDARRRDLRGGRHDHGRLRALPAAARLPPAHAARPRRHRRSATSTSVPSRTAERSSDRSVLRIRFVVG